jgi:hypothetical protein
MTNSIKFDSFHSASVAAPSDLAIPILNEAFIKTFVEAIGGFAWNNDFYEFCNVLQFNSEHSYALEKWQDFQVLNKALGQFDIQSLHKLVEARLQQIKQ